MTVRALSDTAVAEEGRSDYQMVAEEPPKATLVVEQPDGYAISIGVRIPSITQISRSGDLDDGEVIEVKMDASVEVYLNSGLGSRVYTAELPVST